jgi:tetratricopeptide (TPR) repeat protein
MKGVIDTACIRGHRCHVTVAEHTRQQPVGALGQKQFSENRSFRGVFPDLIVEGAASGDGCGRNCTNRGHRVGLGDFFKKLFTAEPVRVDYGSTPNERLVELWQQRTELTEAAVAELRAEAARRGLELPAPRPPRAPTPLPPPKFIVGVHLSVIPPGVVVLRSEGIRAVVALLPTNEPGLSWLDKLQKAPALEVEALVVFNGGEGGVLPTSLVAERLRVPRDAIYALDPSRPADRPHASWPPVTRPVSGARMPKRLVRGLLRVGVLSERPNVVIASWNDVELRALIGPDVKLADVAARSASHVIGGLALESQPSAAQAFGHLEEVIFLPHVVGVTPWAEPLTAMGVTASIAHASTPEPPLPFERIGEALTANDDAALVEAVGTLALKDLESVITAMLLNDREADAERIAVLACERHPDAGVAWFQRGVLAVLRRAPTDAVAAYVRATEVTTPEPRAWANLAAVHGSEGRWAEALRCAETGHRLLPDDDISLGHRLRALLALGRVDEAQTLLAASSVSSLVRTHWEQALERGTPLPPGPSFFPHLARAAIDSAVSVRSIDPAHAVALLQRGLHFDPRLVEARLELSHLLGTLGRDADAEAVVTEGLPFVQHPAELAALLFNRASARARSGQLEAARTDLMNCLELHPAFHQARAQLVSVLSASGALEAAEAQLSVLKREGVEPELVAALEAQLVEVRKGRS